jgi:hypothetical protein
LQAPALPDGALQRAALGELIDRVLIRNGARKEIGNDLPLLVSDRLASEADVESLMKESETLYGLSPDELMSEVLVPQATQDLLSGRLYLKQEKLEDWILEARKKASVILFLGNMKWDGEQVATST